MAEYLAQNLVNLSSWGFRPYRTTELGLNHAEHAFHIGTLVIMIQERVPIEVVEVPHPMPQSVVSSAAGSRALGITLEGNVGSSANGLYRVKVARGWNRLCLPRLRLPGTSQQSCSSRE